MFINKNLETTGHYLLTRLLLPKLKASEQGRIINVSARAHAESDIYFDDLNLENNFSAMKSFGQSKLALIHMTRHMSKLLQGKRGFSACFIIIVLN